MELNTEINKVFGTEMARIFASTISEDEIKAKAETVWQEMNRQNTDQWGKRKNADIERYIRDVILQKLHDKIVEILAEPVNEEKLEAKAREMVQEARKIGEKLIIKQLADNIAEHQYHSYHLMSENITMNIMNQLNAEKNKERGW